MECNFNDIGTKDYAMNIISVRSMTHNDPQWLTTGAGESVLCTYLITKVIGFDVIWTSANWIHCTDRLFIASYDAYQGFLSQHYKNQLASSNQS